MNGSLREFAKEVVKLRKMLAVLEKQEGKSEEEIVQEIIRRCEQAKGIRDSLDRVRILYDVFLILEGVGWKQTDFDYEIESYEPPLLPGDPPGTYSIVWYTYMSPSGRYRVDITGRAGGTEDEPDLEIYDIEVVEIYDEEAGELLYKFEE